MRLHKTDIVSVDLNNGATVNVSHDELYSSLVMLRTYDSFGEPLFSSIESGDKPVRVCRDCFVKK